MVPVRRHARHWRSYLAGGGLVLAFGLVTATAYGGQPQAPNPDNRGAQYHKSPDDPTLSPGTFAVAPPAPPVTWTPLVVQVEPTAKEVHEEAEREAAEAGIFWVKTDSWLVILTFFLTLATTLLWLETWRLRRGADAQKMIDEKARAADVVKLEESLKVSQENAKTALYQARIAEDAYKASNRPWLVVEIYRSEETATRLSFTYQIVNYGNSPAFLHERFALLLSPTRQLTAADIDVQATRRVSGTVIPPGVRSNPEYAVVDQTAQNASGNIRTFVIGLIKYEGVNNLPCQTRFCWEYDSQEQTYYEVQHPYGLNQRL